MGLLGGQQILSIVLQLEYLPLLGLKNPPQEIVAYSRDQLAMYLRRFLESEDTLIYSPSHSYRWGKIKGAPCLLIDDFIVAYSNDFDEEDLINHARALF